MIDRPTLSGAIMNSLLASQRIKRVVDLSALRLATGKKVNSALDNPQNFFAARALNNRAGDLRKLLDGIGSSIRTIEEASNGVTALERLLDQTEAHVQKYYDILAAAGSGTAVVDDPLNVQILAGNPVGYWRMNETVLPFASNLGSIGGAADASYQNAPLLGQAPLYEGGGTSVDLNGTTQNVSIPNHPLLNTNPQPFRSIELVFNADNTSGRQVLYEEGGTTNAFSIYLQGSNIYINGRAGGLWGPVTITAPVVAGQSYHVGFTFDSASNIFRGYLNGVEIGNAFTSGVFPSHTGAIGIGFMNNGSWFHDGAQAGNGNYFQGRISDVAVYNSVLSAQDMINHAGAVTGTNVVEVATAQAAFDSMLGQIDMLVKDAHYRGVHLLMEDDLTTYFNEGRTSKLKIEGVDLTSRGLGIQRTGFDTVEGLQGILDSIRSARGEVRRFGTKLANDLNILNIRDDFTRGTINTLKAGSEDLTVADLNEEGATMLAAQTQLNLAITSLSLASQSRSSVLNLFA